MGAPPSPRGHVILSVYIVTTERDHTIDRFNVEYRLSPDHLAIDVFGPKALTGRAQRDIILIV